MYEDDEMNEGSTPVGGVTIRHMSAEGASAETVSVEQAVQRCRSLMRTGKWMNLVYADGESETIHDGNEFFRNEREAARRLEGAAEVQIMVALQGGC